MKMTPATSRYFAAVAGRWDELRAGYFSEGVRQAALARAYLRDDMVAVDVGAGTGFIAAGLAPLVSQVHVIDGSPEMLAAARKDLQDFSNVAFHLADGGSLPLPDASADAVFANMYLHHCPDPLAAMREMARILRPGGRLILSDMDAHPYAWFREEMADEWLGFERDQVRAWLDQAGLVNRSVVSSGETCSAERIAVSDSRGRTAQVGIFVATAARRVEGAQQVVSEHYAGLATGSRGGCCAESPASQGSCCGEDVSCGCGEAGSVVDDNAHALYTLEQLGQAPQEAAEIALGCGNPTALAGLQAGEVVVDIGSGGGLDAILAARRVGPSGRVIGVDATRAMLARAERAVAAAGLGNIAFRRGDAEALPVEDGTVDVVISNCVINLTGDKGKVFREAYRILKAGGRLEVSDVVTDGSYPLALRTDPGNWSGCVYGALPEREYLDLVAEAGFEDVQVRRSAAAPAAGGVHTRSIQVSARKAAA